jgi:replication factor A1
MLVFSFNKMDDTNYQKILEKIAVASGVEKQEVENMIKAKREKLSGLISLEGAAQVIASELGVNFENERFKLDEILPGMRKVNVIGKIIRLFPVREFTTKAGDSGKVVNLILADDTSNVKVVLWDTNHISLIEEGKIQEGSVVEIINSSVRDNEIHLGSFSEFKISNEVFDSVETEKKVKEKTISDFKVMDSARVRAFIVQAFDLRFFYVCPECKKKATLNDENIYSCLEHGQVSPEKRALLNIVLDDGTENIRGVVFHDNLSILGFENYSDEALLEQKKLNLLGKEFFFSGTVRHNNYFNNEEFIIDNVEEINLDFLISELEGKQ